MINKGRSYNENELSKEIQDYNKNPISSTKELIKKLLQNSLNNPLAKLESNNKKQKISFGLFHEKIKNFTNTIPNVMHKVEEIIKENKQAEKKECFKKIKTVTEYNLKSKFDKIKKNFKIKPKKLTKEEDIANKTISNFKEVFKKNFFKEKNKEKDFHRFKKIPTNTLINFNKNNKTVQNSPKKKIKKEKIRGRNLNNSNINNKSYMTNKGDENKAIITKDHKENKVEKKLISSKSFILKSITNASKRDIKLTFNKSNIIDYKKGIRGKLFNNIKKEINEFKKINKVTGKKGEKLNKTTINSKDEESKGIEKKEEKSNQEETIKEKETKIKTKEEKLSDKLIEKDNRKELFMLNQNKTVTITANSISIIDEIILVEKGESLQYSNSYTYLMDYEVNKLKSKEIYIDDDKIDDTNFEIKKNEYCIIIPGKKIINNDRRKIKIIQEFKNDFSNYSYYDIYLKKEGVLTSFLIKGGDDIQIDDVTNQNFKVYKSMNVAYFEGKITKEIIINNGYLLYSKKYNYQIYKYIPEFKNEENNTIKLKENDYKIAINVLARYKKVVITDYGQEIEDIFKIKLSNYPSKMPCSKISYPLEWNFKYEINIVELNGQKVDFLIIGNSINIFKIGAFNKQFGELHFKYKYFAREIYETFRTESIITNNIKNTYCKLIIEIPNNYAVLGTNDIYLRSKSNDYEYIYNGISNKEEINEFIKLSIKKGEWYIYNEFTLSSVENIEKYTFKIGRFKGGNLKEDSYEVLNENLEEVKDDGERCILTINNLNKSKAIFKLKIRVKNSTADYIFDGNEQLITKVPEEDKQFFKDLSDKIIKEDNSDFPVYKKLGKWVRKYLTYNMFYSGKYLTAKEIYEKRSGVCIHFTLLYNTLLVSQGIKAVEVSGYGLGSWEKEKYKSNNLIENKENINFKPLNSGHRWTVALIDEKWVPLDATWNLFEKNVPLSHIFKFYVNSSRIYSNNQKQNIFLDDTKLEIKYFGN